MDRLRKKTTAHIRFNIASMVAFFLLTSSLSISAGYMPSLVEQLKDKDKAKDVSDRLGLIGEPAIPYLTNVIKDGGKYQKRYAVRSLRNMGPKAESAIPILVTLIKDSDYQTREYLVETLSVMTQADAELIIEKVKAAGFSSVGIDEMKTFIAGMLFHLDDAGRDGGRFSLDAHDTIH